MGSNIFVIEPCYIKVMHLGFQVKFKTCEVVCEIHRHLLSKSRFSADPALELVTVYFQYAVNSSEMRLFILQGKSLELEPGRHPEPAICHLYPVNRWPGLLFLAGYRQEQEIRVCQCDSVNPEPACQHVCPRRIGFQDRSIQTKFPSGCVKFFKAYMRQGIPDPGC